MSDVFISYRRADSASSARLLWENLIKARLIRKRIFFDQKKLRPGERLKTKLTKELSKSKVLVLVIGPKWSELTRLRVDDSKDHSRFEIEFALEHNINIVPVLVEEATQPVAEELGRLAPITELEFLKVRNESFDHDFEILRDTVNRMLGVPSNDRERLEIADIHTVIDWGWSGKKLLKKLVAFDKKVIGGQLGTLNEGTPAQWKDIFWNRPEHWRLLIDSDNKILGYWEMHILFDKYYKKVKRGALPDSKLKLKMMPDFAGGGTYPAYFSMIGIERNRTAGLRLLLDSIFSVLLIGAANGLFIPEITAAAWTEDGLALCKQLGMKRTRKRDNTIVPVPICCGSISQILGTKFAKQCSNIDTLRGIYEEQGLITPSQDRSRKR